MRALSDTNHNTMLRSMRPLIVCFAFAITAQAAMITSHLPHKQQHQQQQQQQQQQQHQKQKPQRHHHPILAITHRLRRSRPLDSRRGGTMLTRRSQLKGPWKSAWLSIRGGQSAWTVRGGEHGHNNHQQGQASGGNGNLGSATTAADGSGAAAEKLDKIGADGIVADVGVQGEAIAAGLRSKHEKITDEVMRERFPGASGESGGFHSYDSATAGMDVANRRTFFLGIRRVVLLVQVVELILACSWQAAFPFGGVAGFVAVGPKLQVMTSDGGEGDGRGRLGLAVAASLGQAALYTILLVFFGCDRVVLRAVRLTGWEHGAAAAWTLMRAFSTVGKLTHLAACVWLAGMALVCVYFGRQL